MNEENVSIECKKYKLRILNIPKKRLALQEDKETYENSSSYMYVVDGKIHIRRNVIDPTIRNAVFQAYLEAQKAQQAEIIASHNNGLSEENNAPKLR